MAKKSKKKSTTNKGTTASVSTRFSSKERDIIERAANLRNWSPAKLIHEATIRRAADIINASEGQELALALLAREVVRQIVNPDLEIEWKNHDFCPEESDPDFHWGDGRQWTIYQGEDCFKGRVDGGDIEIFGFKGNALKVETREQIKAALDTCPTEFADMILNHLQNEFLGDEGYRPVINVKELENE